MDLTTLFVDMNSYFASVEQQLCPRLRGCPVCVAPTVVDTTCCIAASYEAKRLGITTGTAVREARRICRDIQVVEARPLVYTEMHHRIVEAAESCLPVGAIHSIDEFSCRLIGRQREPDKAVALAGQIKAAIRDRIGPCVRCSIGIAPNRFLAKVASDMQKPDGLVVIRRSDLPARLYPLELQDLPGIGAQMHRRLEGFGIHTVKQLCAQTEEQLGRVWNSVTGRLWWHWLHGHDMPDPPTHRRTVGHSHVLPPQLRNDVAACAVGAKMLHKAAARLRRMNYWARDLSLHLSYFDRPGWTANARLGLTQDTLAMMKAYGELWRRRPRDTPAKVSVTLFNLVDGRYATLPLFAQERNRIELARVMDAVNMKYGINALYPALMHGGRDAAPTRISFTSIPDLDLPA